MGMGDELNCTTNLKRIVRRLPTSMQLKWAEVADDILCEGSQPSFKNLVTFLDERLTVATNCYSRIIAGDATVNRGTEFQRRKIFSTSVSERASECICCNENSHTLGDCRNFRLLERKQKLDLLLKNGLCFNCLLRGHRTAECQSTVRCSQYLCGRKHHNCLHIQGTKIGPRNQVSINSAYQMSQKCYLGFIPVRLKGPLGSIETYAFLDNGSDTTLIDHTTAETLGLLGASRKLTIATLHGTEVHNLALVTIDVEAIDRSHSLKIDDAYVIKELPIKDACTPSEVSMKDWPHLRDVQLHRLPNRKISILIGTNVPESQWVIEQRIGNRKQPFASRTVFGWVIFGPNDYNFRKGTSVNCIATQQSTD